MQKNRMIFWAAVCLGVWLSVLGGRSMMALAKEGETTGGESELLPGRQWMTGEDAGTAYVRETEEGGIELFSTAGADCTITPGTRHYYGSWLTNEFAVSTDSGEFTGYCAQPNQATPSGVYQISKLNNNQIKSLLLVAPGGDYYSRDFWNWFGYNPATGGEGGNDAYSLAHACIGYVYSGETTGLSRTDIEEISGYIKGINEWYHFSEELLKQYTVYVAYNNAQDIVWIEKNPVGYVGLKKQSAVPALTDGNGLYSLKGAVYGVYSDSGCKTKAAELVTDAGGNSSTAELEEGTYYIKELTSPEGYIKDKGIHKVTVSGGQTAALNVTDVPQSLPVNLLLEKQDAETSQKTPQGKATLSGAEFTVKYYRTQQSTDPAEDGIQADRTWILKTDANGCCFFSEEYKISGDAFYYISSESKSPVLPLGTVTIQETEAPEGYLPDSSVYVKQITGESGEATLPVYQAPVISEAVIRGGVCVEKWDRELGENRAQGAATLQGAVFEVISLNENPVVVKGKTYGKNEVILTLTTDEQGKVKTSNRCLPYGEYRVRETASPEGYNDTGILERDFSVTKEGAMAELNTSDKAILNDVIRGDLQLVKFMEDQDSEQDRKTPLQGMVFMITSKTTGNTWQIETDENGYASTKQLGISDRGNLVYDTYFVKETNTPEGLKPVHDFEITISKEGQNLYYILEDKIILSPVQLIKTDSTTGKIIPLAGAEFQLLDEEKRAITMTTYYPEKVVHETFLTDENGSFILPEKLPVGTYYFREVTAPEGYLPGEDIEFQIEEGHDWKEPFIVECSNAPAMGRVEIFKTDEESSEALSGAVFDILAAEDIATPDGTVRFRKGETVDSLTTNEKGEAVSKELFLGNYIVKEMLQPAGYVRLKEAYNISLEYQGQNVPVVTERAELSNLPTRLKIVKTDIETKEPLAGVKLAVWRKTKPEDTEEPEKHLLTTDENGEIILEYFPPGIYCVQEVETLPGYILDETVREMRITEDGRVIGEESGVLFLKNVPTKLVKTTLRDSETKTGEAEPKEHAVWIDTVEFQDLQIGQEYRIEGILMNPANNELLLVDGKPVTAMTSFTAERSDGTAEVEFQLDASSLQDCRVVAFEKVFIGETEILSHENIEDPNQTIRVRTKRPAVPEEERSVKTGDRTKMLPWILAAAVAGAFLYRQIRGRKNTKKKIHTIKS